MTIYRLNINTSYEVECDSEDDCYNELEERFAIENTTAENEFWDSIEIEEIEDE